MKGDVYVTRLEQESVRYCRRQWTKFFTVDFCLWVFRTKLRQVFYSGPQELPKESRYVYFLRHRTTDATIELGYTPVLTDQQIAEHKLSVDTWEIDWEFCSRRETP